jgi:hypothetical protein
MDFASALRFELQQGLRGETMHAWSRPKSPYTRGYNRWAVRLALAALGPWADAEAQLPGLPVLQNAFVAPGLAAAVNAGGGSGATAYAAAVGWAPRSGRFQVSLGAGVFVSSGNTGGAFGLRAAVPVFSMMGGDLGVAGFVGVGGAQGPQVPQRGRAGLGQVPLGAAVAYRRALGATRGFSVYAAPFAGFFRNDFGDAGTESATLFRVSVGGDFAFTQAIGVTAGLEAGASRDDGPGPSGVVWGVGVSYAFGRR